MHTWLDVLAHDGDVAVPVGPRVLVPEADDVAQLMHHDSKLVTVLADGDGLRAPTTATHVGAAPGGRGQLRGAVPSWGSASTQGPGEAARGAGSGGARAGLAGLLGMCAGVTARHSHIREHSWGDASRQEGTLTQICAQVGQLQCPGQNRGWGTAEGTLPRGPCSPAGSIGEYDVAVLVGALQEGNTGVLLPVPHGLPEDCPLAACGTEAARLSHRPGGPASTHCARVPA